MSLSRLPPALRPAGLLRMTLLYGLLMAIFADQIRAQEQGWGYWAGVVIGMTVLMVAATATLLFGMSVSGAGGWLAWRAVQARAAGQSAAALAGFDRVLQRRPDAAEALVGRAELRIAAGDSVGALADLTQAIAVTPHVLNFPDPILYRAYLARGQVRDATGDLAGALGDWRQASRAAPGQPDPYLLRGQAVAGSGLSLDGRADLATAVHLLTGQIERTEDRAEQVTLLNGRGIAYTLLDEPRRGLADLEAALQLDPTHWPTHYNLGATYLRLGHPDHALLELGEAIRRAPAARAAARTSRVYAPLRDDADFQALVG
jgi:tetratricopeptide (TPR) repeat protein